MSKRSLPTSFDRDTEEVSSIRRQILTQSRSFEAPTIPAGTDNDSHCVESGSSQIPQSGKEAVSKVQSNKDQLFAPDCPFMQTNAAKTILEACSEPLICQAERLSDLAEVRQSAKTTFDTTFLIEPFKEDWWKCQEAVAIHLGFTDTTEGVGALHEWMRSAVFAPFLSALVITNRGNILKSIKTTSGTAFAWLRKLERIGQSVEARDPLHPEYLADSIVTAMKRSCPKAWLIIFALFRIYEANTSVDGVAFSIAQASMLDDKGQVRWYALWGAVRFLLTKVEEQAFDLEKFLYSPESKKRKRNQSFANLPSRAKELQSKPKSAEKMQEVGSGGARKEKGVGGLLDQSAMQPANNDSYANDKTLSLDSAVKHELELAQALAQPEGFYI